MGLKGREGKSGAEPGKKVLAKMDSQTSPVICDLRNGTEAAGKEARG